MGRKRDRRSCNKQKCPASKFGKNLVYSSKSHGKMKKEIGLLRFFSLQFIGILEMESGTSFLDIPKHFTKLSMIVEKEEAN